MKQTTTNLWVRPWILLLFAFTTFTSLAQTPVRCYTDEMDSIRRANDPTVESAQGFENWLQNEIQNNAGAKIVGGVYQIPVVVHVIHNGEAVGTGSNVSFAAIQSQIDVLNEDFRKMMGTNGWNTNPVGADTEIEFCLAQRRPDGSAFAAGEPGVNRINRTTAGFTAPPFTTAYIDATIKTWTYNGGVPTATRGWDPNKYMNIWLCDISGGILGYAQFPQSPLGGMSCGAPATATDGVVFLYNSIGKSSVTGFAGPYNEGRTATHEIGHWLGLRHIWGDGNCSVDDFCNDTPVAGAANYGCPTGTNSCTAAPDAGVDQIENYMDYTDDLCMNIFTIDQKARMRTVLENSPLRANLITSDACVPPSANDASVVDIVNPKGDNCAGSIVPTVVLRNRGSSNLTSATISYSIDNGTITTFSWTGTLTPGSSANVNLPAFTTTLGTHNFKAYSTLPNGVVDPSTLYDTSSINFVVSNGEMAPFLETFDGGTFPPDIRWVIDNPNSDCYEWVSASATSITGALNNNAAQFPGFGNGTGGTENMITPIFILPCNATAANIQFDVAYRRRNNTAGNYDRLYIEISQDCGATWTATPIYDKTGTALQVLTTTLNAYYTPVGITDWRTETVNLLPFVTGTSKNVKFRFRAVAANGNNIYVDNFRFNATTPGEIELTQGTTDVLDGGYYSYGSVQANTPTTAVFTITNTGTTNLVLTGPINVTGTGFTLASTFGATTLAAGASTTFSVTFNSATVGSFTGNVSFGTNDCDEATYNFQLNATCTATPPVADFIGTPLTVCAGSTVTFTNLSTNATSYSWNFGPGATPSTSTAANPTVTFNTIGTNTIILTATNAFGSDVETKTNYITVLDATGVALPISEGFTTATFVPAGWSLVNTNASPTTWVRSATIGVAPTAGNSMMFDNFTYNDSDDDQVRLPGASFMGLSSAQLQFDVAYAAYNATNVDGLQVLVSTDCGVTFTSVYNKTGSTVAAGNLPTAAATTTAFTPTAAQWRTETVDLSAYVGNSKVIVAFKNLSGYGNRLFVDNINLTGVVSTTPPTASFTGTPTTVCSGQTVTFTNTSTGSPTSYSWSFPGGTPATSTAANPTVTYNTAGTYNVSLTATNGGGSNTSTQTNYITVNATPAAPVVTVTNNCGNSVLTATGSNLLWSTGATTASITVTTAGTYTVTQTVGGCTSPAGSGVAAPLAVPTAPVVTVTNNCGNSVLTATGTNLLWSTGATTASITVTTAGTYTVTQTVGGCTSSAGSGVAAPLAVPTAPVVTVSNNCGNSVLTATGTNLLWSTGATTASITVTTAGTYTVTQTVGGCTSPAGSGVAAPLAIPTAPVVTVTNNCGNSILTATGTNLLWSTGATTASITVTTAGTYTVTQTVGGCASSAGSGVAAPLAAPVISLGTTTNPSSCGSSTGSIVINGSGTGNVVWTGTASGSATGVTLPYTISGLAAGSYAVSFNNGCASNTVNATLADPSAPSAPVVTVTNNCGNSVLTATGTNLLWSTGATTSSITVTTAGTYTVTQTSGGCVSAAGSGIAAPNAIPAAPGISAVDGCGSSVLTATGTNLLWSTGATTASITVTTAGLYTVTQTVGGCTSAPSTVAANPVSAPSAPVTTVLNNCGSSVLMASGSNLLWSTGATTSSITVTTAGTYTVTQTVGGCTSAPSSVTAAPLTVPVITLGTTTNPSSCGTSTGSIVINGSGTGNVVWTGTASGSATGVTLPYTISGLAAGSYAVSFNNGCTSNTVNGTLADPSAPSAPVVTVTNNCGNSVLTATGSNLLWSTGATTASITVTTAGTYTVTQSSGGCVSAAGSGIAAPSAIPAAPSVSAVDGCGSSVLTATGTNLLWSTGATTASITVTTAGLYTVTQTVGGCTSAPSTVAANPVSAPSAPVTTVLNNCGSSVLMASGSNLLWSTGATTSSITVTTAGTYTVTQTVGGCTSAPSSVTAAPNAIPSAPVVSAVDGCGSSVLTATGSNLLWSTGATTSSITVTSAGTYTVTQTVNGCTSSPSTVSANPTAGGSAPVTTVTNNCGNSILSVSGAGTILWSTGETSSTIVVTNAGTYTVTLTSGSCTSAPASVVAAPVAIPAAPVVTVNNKCGTADLLTSATGSLMWSTSETTSMITVTTPGTYYVSQTVNGCTSPVGTAVANPFTVPNVTFAPLADVCINAPAFTLTGGSPAGGTYSGTGVSANTFDPSVAGYGVFTITYEYIDGNGCSGMNQQPITVGCAGDEELVSAAIAIYPNPTNGIFTISSGSVNVRTITIYDAAGKLVMEVDNATLQENIPVDLSNYAEGVYSLEIETEDTLLRERVILTK